MKKCCKEHLQRSLNNTWYCPVCKLTYYSEKDGEKFIEQIKHWKDEATKLRSCLTQLRKNLGLE